MASIRSGWLRRNVKKVVWLEQKLKAQEMGRKEDYPKGMQDEENIRVRTWELMTSHAMWLTSLQTPVRTNRNMHLTVFHGNDFGQ